MTSFSQCMANGEWVGTLGAVGMPAYRLPHYVEDLNAQDFPVLCPSQTSCLRDGKGQLLRVLTSTFDPYIN